MLDLVVPSRAWGLVDLREAAGCLLGARVFSSLVGGSLENLTGGVGRG